MLEGEMLCIQPIVFPGRPGLGKLGPGEGVCHYLSTGCAQGNCQTWELISANKQVRCKSSMGRIWESDTRTGGILN